MASVACVASVAVVASVIRGAQDARGAWKAYGFIRLVLSFVFMACISASPAMDPSSKKNEEPTFLQLSNVQTGCSPDEGLSRLESVVVGADSDVPCLI